MHKDGIKRKDLQSGRFEEILAKVYQTLNGLQFDRQIRPLPSDGISQFTNVVIRYMYIEVIQNGKFMLSEFHQAITFCIFLRRFAIVY